MRRTANRAFTLIEILIVVVILGILAAIVIPQFSDASEDAARSSVQSQLQTVRSQIELYRVQNQGTLPVDAADLIDWDLLTNVTTNPQNERYLQQDPRNPLRNNATGIELGTAASTASADTMGWVWDEGEEQLYAYDAIGVDTVLTDPNSGNPW